MQGKRGDKPPFGRLDEGVARQGQKGVERVRALERGREREKMHRQEDRERDAGEPMQERRDEASPFVSLRHHQARPRLARYPGEPGGSRFAHAEYTAKTARSPRPRS